MTKQQEFLNKESLILTWSNNWIMPYESPWGIIQKLKYANFISSDEILRFFGNEKVKKIKGKIGDVHRSLIRLDGLDETTFRSVLGCPIKEKNDQVIKMLFQGFYNFAENTNFYFRKELCFCNICLSKGYHSTIFQSKLVHNCPFHEQPLVSGCPKCKKSIPYLLTDEYTEEPFMCRCGELWLSSNNYGRPISSWTDTKIGNIQSKELIKWINLNEKQIKKLRKFRYFPGFDLESINGITEYLLSIVDTEFESEKNNMHRKIVASKNLNSLKIDISKVNKGFYPSKRKFDNEKIDSWFLLRNNEKYKYYYDNIYESSRKTVSSVARHIRNTIYPEHKSCVKRLIKQLKENNKTLEPFCMHAFAYINWKKSVEGIEHIYRVDNYGYPHRREVNGVDIASNIDRNYIQTFIDDWIDYFEVIPKKQLVGLKWILNRMVSILIVNHYKNWLRIATKYGEYSVDANFDRYLYRELPFFFFVYPSKVSEPIEVHWWSNKNDGCS